MEETPDAAAAATDAGSVVVAVPASSYSEALAALRQLGETGRQPLLDPVEVAGPVRQALLDAALDEGESLAKLAREPPLSLSELAAPRFGELSFVFRQARARLGPRARKRALELVAAPNRLAFNQLP